MASIEVLPRPFGRYVLLEKVGEGGMGTVYLAEDRQLNRRVALKMPHFQEGEDTTNIDRFYREARVAAGIEHPNLCPVYDVGQIDGIHYLTMPYIDGTPLSRMVRGGHPWPPRQAAQLVRQLAQAIHYLHQRGVMHRDLKPGNIMIRLEGDPVLMDFGLARAFNSDSQRITATASSVGTPAYMSPEQILNDRAALGPGTDIYALGVILYELLSGQLPFTGPPALVYGQILHADPQRPSTLQPGIPPALDGICMRALAKKVEQRFRSMEDFAFALDTYLQQTATESGPMPTLRTHLTGSDTNKLGDSDDEPALVRVVCSGCGQKLRLPEAPRGRRLKCPRCGTVVLTNPSGGQRVPTPMPTPHPLNSATVPEQTVTTPPRPRAWVPLVIALLAVLGTTAFVGWHMFKPDNTRGGSNGDPGNGGSTVLLGEEVTNSLGMKFRRIPAGSFVMGSPDGEERREDDEFQHPVTISRPFFMGVHEVTQSQFRQVMGTNPSYHQEDGRVTDDQPVEYVTYDEAVEFCARLGTLAAEKRTRHRYRLPTEAEWEYACRAGTTTPFHFGEDLSSFVANFDGNYQYGNAQRGPYTARPTPVGSYDRPNAWGLHDMHGNVWEWCSDWYDRDYYRHSPQTDPQGPRDGTMRVVRGGSWLNVASDLRSATRFYDDPTRRAYNRGFRIILTAE